MKKLHWWILILVTCALVWWSAFEVASYVYDLFKALIK